MKKIKEVSEMTGVSRRTLQFYDEIGLLPAERTENNYRVYDEEALGRLWRILIYREIGCKLSEIKELLSAAPKEQYEILDRHIDNMTQVIEKLKKNICLTTALMEHKEFYYEFLRREEGKWVERIKEKFNYESEKIK